jgi:hypothetical protein
MRRQYLDVSLPDTNLCRSLDQFLDGWNAFDSSRFQKLTEIRQCQLPVCIVQTHIVDSLNGQVNPDLTNTWQKCFHSPMNPLS